MWILQQVVKNVRGQNRLFGQRLPQFVALDPFAVLLAFVEMERILLGFFVPFERTTNPVRKLFIVRQNRPAVRNGRRRVAVDDVVRSDDLGMAESDTAHSGDVITLGEPVDIGGIMDAVTRHRYFQAVCQGDVERKFAHFGLLCDVWSVIGRVVAIVR